MQLDSIGSDQYQRSQFEKLFQIYHGFVLTESWSLSFLILCLGNGCSIVSDLLIGLKLTQ